MRTSFFVSFSGTCDRCSNLSDLSKYTQGVKILQEKSGGQIASLITAGVYQSSARRNTSTNRACAAIIRRSKFPPRFYQFPLITYCLACYHLLETLVVSAPQRQMQIRR